MTSVRLLYPKDNFFAHFVLTVPVSEHFKELIKNISEWFRAECNKKFMVHNKNLLQWRKTILILNSAWKGIHIPFYFCNVTYFYVKQDNLWGNAAFKYNVTNKILVAETFKNFSLFTSQEIFLMVLHHNKGNIRCVIYAFYMKCSCQDFIKAVLRATVA